MRAGWEVVVSLVVAGASAVGVVLNLLDIGETVSGSRRYEAAVASFALFAASVALLLYRQRNRIIALEALLAPKVQIVFDEGGKRPYLQRQRLLVSEDVGAEEWRYRIGIRNLGKTEITRVRAVIESIEPIGSEGFKRHAKDHIYPGQPLRAMGKPDDTDEFLLGVSGDEPSVYVDVAHDHLSDEGATGLICFAYAATHMPNAAMAGTYRITIRVEGGGTYDRRTFLVDREGKEKHLRMRTDSSSTLLGPES
jgi:hypothetical protein